MKALLTAALYVIAPLGVCIVIALAYPPAAIPLAVGVVAGYLVGRTRAEVGRATADQSGIYRRMSAYRGD